MVQITEYSILKQFYVGRVVVHGCGTCRRHRQDSTRKVQNWGGYRDKNLSLVHLFTAVHFLHLTRAFSPVQPRGWGDTI
eukprot:10324623-Ditylum_brightwellii.AAC.1